MATNGCYYNTTKNIYIYPTNVESVYIEKGMPSDYIEIVNFVANNPCLPMFNTGYNYDYTALYDSTISNYVIKVFSNKAPSQIAFNACNYSLKAINHMNTVNLTTTNNMFANCGSFNLSSINYSNWPLSNITSSSYMFKNSSNIK